VVRSSSVSAVPAWGSKKRERSEEGLFGRQAEVAGGGVEKGGVTARGGRREDVEVGGGVGELKEEEVEGDESFAVVGVEAAAAAALLVRVTGSGATVSTSASKPRIWLSPSPPPPFSMDNAEEADAKVLFVKLLLLLLLSTLSISDTAE